MPRLQEEAGTALSEAPSSTGAGGRPGRRPALLWLLGVVAALVVVADQATKWLALQHLSPGEPHDVVGTWIRLNLIRNAGAAFSLGERSTWLLTIIAVAVLVAIVTVARRLGSTAWALALGLILGGAIGNLIDRFFREPGVGRGHVVDFIDYFGLFIGNVADIAIVTAAVLIAVLSLRGVPTSGEPAGRHTEETQDDPT
ncbi:Lipoprotein signal peptidase (modular protein) [Nostocoides japonicum T1-X7]|uniref:Lipoprotein signal peptidase n=1 Tax=Nostocoides japonicum T1-X7 TaxID=1194083 RepID=A0A077M154_9MICO|nr:signal peptidase II [Tetrasphaera japonica]CCH77934.1 Lipoprotein signal peptidase (modular protein) [Tetrasphaera japonica T1-X7]